MNYPAITLRPWRWSGFTIENARARQPSAGFTLVELLVCLAIITILAALLGPVIASGRRRGYDSENVSNLHQLGIGAELYHQEDGAYPDSPTLLFPSYCSSSQLAQSHNDPFNAGIGVVLTPKVVRSTRPAPKYKLSFLGGFECGRTAQYLENEVVVPGTPRGLFVDLTPMSGIENLPASETSLGGRFRRLTEDGGMVMRPNPAIQHMGPPYTGCVNLSWYLDDIDAAARAKECADN